MNALTYLNISIQDENGYTKSQTFAPVNGQTALDLFCNYLVREGIVDEIKYSRHFSLIRETTKALEGRQ